MSLFSMSVCSCRYTFYFALLPFLYICGSSGPPLLSLQLFVPPLFRTCLASFSCDFVVTYALVVVAVVVARKPTASQRKRYLHSMQLIARKEKKLGKQRNSKEKSRYGKEWGTKYEKKEAEMKREQCGVHSCSSALLKKYFLCVLCSMGNALRQICKCGRHENLDRSCRCGVSETGRWSLQLFRNGWKGINEKESVKAVVAP